MPSVVQIRTTLESPYFNDKRVALAQRISPRSGGTGVVIGSGGIILTNAHVLRDATAVTVVLSDGSEHGIERVVIDPHLDLAVIRIGDIDVEPLRPVDLPPELGAFVVAVSLPGADVARAVRPGVVTNPSMSLQTQLDPRRTRNYDGLIESTTRIEPGFSGGPLLDGRGRLVGLNVAVAGPTDTVLHRGYALPFNNRTRTAVERLVEQAMAASGS